MGKNSQIWTSSRTQYSRYLGDFRGVDFSSSPAMVAENRFSYLKNMWKDYESGQGQAIESMTGFRVVSDALQGKGEIYSIYQYGDNLMVKCGTDLYVFDSADLTAYQIVCDNLCDGAITAFVFNNEFYFLDGKHYYCYNGQEKSWRSLLPDDSGGIPYIPTTYIDGEEYEQRNLLTNYFKEKAYAGGDVVQPTDVETATAGLKYKGITSSGEVVELQVTYAPSDTDILVIPDTASYGGHEYPVRSVAKASGNENRSKVVSLPSNCTIMSSGVSGYSSGMFVNNTNLETLIFRSENPTVTTDSQAVIKNGMFLGCTHLKYIYLNFYKWADSSGVEQWNMGFEVISGTSESGETTLGGVVSGKIFESSITDTVKIFCNITEQELKTVSGYSMLPLKYDSDGNITNLVTGVSYGGTVGAGSVIYDITLFDEMPSAVYVNGKWQNNKGTVTYEGWSMDDLGWTVSWKTGTSGSNYETVRIFADNTVTAGGEFEIKGRGVYNKITTAKKQSATVYDANASYDSGTEEKALDMFRKCTVTAIFDGRVFFTGNPDLPNTVFYSARDLTSANNPTYVGCYNYFNDGVGDKRNVAMISTPSMLVVCKEDTRQDGSCYYHTGQDSGYDLIPRVYPSTEGVSGIGCVGSAVNFADDPVFLSRDGLMAIGKQTVNLERTVEHRSQNIDLLLKQCNLKSAKMAEWKGYLLILVDGKLFMADSRQLFTHGTGVTQYEWYYADDIGVYSEQKNYLALTTGSIWGTVDGEKVDITDETYANRLTYKQNGGSEGICYANREETSDRFTQSGDDLIATNAGIYLDGKSTGLTFPIVKTQKGAYIASYIEEYYGGTFHPCTSLCDCDGRLFMGTEDGRLVCMNTDMRGKTVYRAIRLPDGFTAPSGDTRTFANPTKNMVWTDCVTDTAVETDFGTYKTVTSGGVTYLVEEITVGSDEIWSGFYNRNGREIVSVCETLYDASSYPQIAKNTIRKSTFVRSKIMGTSEFRVYLRSNRERVWKECRKNSRGFDMAETEFSNMSFTSDEIAVSVIPDRMKRWQWQQFRFESAGYNKPFGLLDLFYRYENGGNVK